jgi:hypothetical protein
MIQKKIQGKVTKWLKCGRKSMWLAEVRRKSSLQENTPNEPHKCQEWIMKKKSKQFNNEGAG